MYCGGVKNCEWVKGYERVSVSVQWCGNVGGHSLPGGVCYYCVQEIANGVLELRDPSTSMERKAELEWDIKWREDEVHTYKTTIADYNEAIGMLKTALMEAQGWQGYF